MKIKIFNLIRTQLHNDTSVWSFPTFAQAQDKMLEEAAKEVGIDKSILLIENEHYFFKGYDVWRGNDYITISDGNKVEYEIKQTSMDTYQMQVERIIDKVMMFSGAGEEYRELIKYELLCYTENDLPFYDDEIEHFVDTELRERFAKRAAAKIVSGYDNDFQDKYFKVVEDYLRGNRGLSLILAVINGEEDAADDVKGEINKQEGKNVFQTDYVWLYKSKYMSGKHFIALNETRIFKSLDSACMELKQKREEVIRKFRQYYNNVESFEDGNAFRVRDEETNDVWDGYIIKTYIED